MRTLRWLISLALLGGGAPANAAAGLDPPEWTQAIPPFHIVGPIDYVGTRGIAVYLIRTQAGLILLDGGMEESAPDVERAISSLGLRITDVKLILATHAHFDHAGGLARLKRDSGAVFAASAADSGAYEAGTPPSDTSYGVIRFPPVKVDRTVLDGVPVKLGDVTMTPILTAGHTPGCTTWTMQVTQVDRPLRVIFPCSLTVAGNKLVGNRGYPAIASDFRKTFARMRMLRADVVLPAHPEVADVLGRERLREAGQRDAFVAPDLLPRLVAKAGAAFESEMAKATTAGSAR